MKTSRMLVAKERTSLFEYLQAHYPETKRTVLKQLLKHGAVFVNGNPVTRHNHLLEPRDRVVIERGAPTPAKKSAVVKLDIVYEDRHVIVINKPEGLLTIATEKETQRTAYRQVMAYVQDDRPHWGERIFIVHRLDRDTSGLLVFARNEESKRAMQDRWEQAEKKYYAVVEGVPHASEGTFRSYLRESPKSLKMHSAPPSDDSKLAVTRFRVIRSERHFALLDVKLETGRKNQIRAHLSENGNPVVGDKKYDARGNPMKRLGLHAYFLAFPHPITGKRLLFKTDIPNEFVRLLEEDVPAAKRRSAATDFGPVEKKVGRRQTSAAKPAGSQPRSTDDRAAPRGAPGSRAPRAGGRVAKGGKGPRGGGGRARREP